MSEKLSRVAYYSGERLTKLNKLLRRLGYFEAEENYLANIVDGLEPMDVSARRRLYEEIAVEFGLEPPDVI